MLASCKGMIIHCSATPPDHPCDAAMIKRWHLGRGWRDTGYHWVIERDGKLVKGRDGVGAHCKGQNHQTGVCLIGGVSTDNKAEFNYTIEQWRTLIKLIDDLKPSKVSGHNEYSDKACPSFCCKYLQ